MNYDGEPSKPDPKIEAKAWQAMVISRFCAAATRMLHLQKTRSFRSKGNPRTHDFYAVIVMFGNS